MTTLYDKIANLPPSLLPRLERFVDALPDTTDDWDLPLYDENGNKVHPKAGCLKGLIVMHDNFFEPDEDDDWERYV